MMQNGRISVQIGSHGSGTCGGWNCVSSPPRLSEIFGNLQGEEAVREAVEVGTTHLGALGPPGTPWWVVLPSEPPSGTSLAQQVSSSPEKSLKSFAAFGLRLVLIFYEVKNKQKTATGTAQYVNRLVPKNDIKLL